MSPLWHHQETLTALSHTVTTEKRDASFPTWNFGGFQGALNSCKAFSEITQVWETALSILLFINCLQLFSISRESSSFWEPGKDMTEQRAAQTTSRSQKSWGRKEILFHPFLTASYFHAARQHEGRAALFCILHWNYRSFHPLLTQRGWPRAVLVWGLNQPIKPAWKQRRRCAGIFHFQL